MDNLIVFGIIIVILGSAVGYIVWQKKRGVKCVGCSNIDCCEKIK